MAKILIDIFPAQGHFNGTLKIVTLLKNAGHDIVYLNMNTFQYELKKYSFENVLIEQFAMPFVLGNLQFRFRLFIEKLFIAKKKEFFAFEEFKFRSFKNSICEISPDLVLLDDQNMLKAIYYELCKVKVVCIDTMPESGMIQNIPPYSSFFVPSESNFSKWVCKLLWVIKKITNKWYLEKLRINLLGTDSYSVACKIAFSNNINLKNRTDLNRGFNLGIDGIQHIIAAPAAFDFPHLQKDGVFNIGPLVNINREGEIEKSRYNVLRENLNKFKEKESGFIIYCSLGTITKSFQSRIKKFFIKMIRVAINNPSDLFILSAGKDFDINGLFPISDNLYVFEFVPQVDLLQYCDIMITHGGMNTITECIFCEVPMLVYPLSPYWDQPGNSARVVYHGLGLNGKINKDSAKTISNKLNQIKSNYSFYKRNILAMKAKFEEKNNSLEVVNIIENILNETKQE